MMVKPKPRFCLEDKNPVCMECQKPFSEHTPQDEINCRHHALNRRASIGNITYLNEGFKLAKGKSDE